jgi:hypothetical protein
LGAPPYSGGVLRFLLVVIIFAALVYALMWSIERRRGQGGGGGGGGGRPGRGPLGPGPGRGRPEPRQVAPDDDEDFLRGLARKRRKDTPGNEPPA